MVFILLNERGKELLRDKTYDSLVEKINSNELLKVRFEKKGLKRVESKNGSSFYILHKDRPFGLKYAPVKDTTKKSFAKKGCNWFYSATLDVCLYCREDELAAHVEKVLGMKLCKRDISSFVKGKRG